MKESMEEITSMEKRFERKALAVFFSPIPFATAPFHNPSVTMLCTVREHDNEMLHNTVVSLEQHTPWLTGCSAAGFVSITSQPVINTLCLK